MMHLILDFETIGKRATSVAVIECSFRAFEWDDFTESPLTYVDALDKVQYYKLNVLDQVQEYGYVIEKSGLAYWKDLRPSILKPTENDLLVPEFISAFIEYCKEMKPKYWWSRSNTFDPIILWRLAESCGREKDLEAVLPFWKVRDVRTFIDAKSNFMLVNNNSFIPVNDDVYWKATHIQHHSSHDIAADILRMQTLIRLDNELKILER